MRIAVVGAGAIGGFAEADPHRAFTFAPRLQRHFVAVFEKSSRLAAR